MQELNIRQYTAEKHRQAEATDFMRAVFAGKLAPELWCDFCFQKTLFYNTIETAARSLGLLDSLPGIERTHKLYQDYLLLATTDNRYNRATMAYQRYLISISRDATKILAHLYVWHMGDLHGGQMISRILPGKHTSLEFANAPELIAKIKSLITADVIPEILVAFDWAIEILNEYRISNLE